MGKTIVNEIEKCTQCPHCTILPDPDPYDWFICDDDDINYARENTKDSVQAAWFHCSHKATVEELIEHFKSV